MFYPSHRDKVLKPRCPLLTINIAGVKSFYVEPSQPHSLGLEMFKNNKVNV